MDWFMNHYLTDTENRNDGLADAARQPVGLPDCFIATCEFDRCDRAKRMERRANGGQSRPSATTG
jgi:hypothetical protein